MFFKALKHFDFSRFPSNVTSDEKELRDLTQHILESSVDAFVFAIKAPTKMYEFITAVHSSKIHDPNFNHLLNELFWNTL